MTSARMLRLLQLVVRLCLQDRPHELLLRPSSPRPWHHAPIRKPLTHHRFRPTSWPSGCAPSARQQRAWRISVCRWQSSGLMRLLLQRRSLQRPHLRLSPRKPRPQQNQNSVLPKMVARKRASQCRKGLRQSHRLLLSQHHSWHQHVRLWGLGLPHNNPPRSRRAPINRPLTSHPLRKPIRKARYHPLIHLLTGQGRCHLTDRSTR